MKKQINVTKWITDPLFQKKILFIFSDKDYAEKAIKKKYDVTMELTSIGEVLDIAGPLIIFIDSTLWDYTISNYAVLAHEIFHLTFFIQSSVCYNEKFQINEVLSEHTAYLLEALYAKVLKQITIVQKYK